ncbi:radical SAM protein, partial [Armatimonas sp.]|uniref:radical SAM protein n=1 Tax=Armatimonas sp. TaxID=1872638 RepID=UPI003753C942
MGREVDRPEEDRPDEPGRLVVASRHEGRSAHTELWPLAAFVSEPARTIRRSRSWERISGERLNETRLNVLPTLGPQSVSVVLTNACNLRCLTCWSYSPLRKELPMADWRRKRLGRALLKPFFAELAALGTERVIFTGGGDPLAHPECLDVFADARRAGLKVTLISNLTLVRDREAFLALGLNTILANFSCADPETYVAFHPGRSEADFYTLIALLRDVVAAGTQLKLVFVVCAVNCHVLEKALLLAKELGASVQFKLM